MISHQKMPEGGWKYKHPKTGINLVGNNWDNLVSLAKKHCKSNGLSDVDIEIEIEKQIAQNHPELVINKVQFNSYKE